MHKITPLYNPYKSVRFIIQPVDSGMFKMDLVGSIDRAVKAGVVYTRIRRQVNGISDNRQEKRLTVPPHPQEQG